VSAFQNPADDVLRALLTRTRSIAVVGLSPKPDRPSYQVAAQMQRLGYRIIPVRPALHAVLGETAYPDLASIPGPVDLVDVFRAPEYVDEIVDFWTNPQPRHPWRAALASAIAPGIALPPASMQSSLQSAKSRALRQGRLDERLDARVARQLPALWLQEGVVNEAAAMRAQAAGMTVVMDRCVWREYQRLIGAAGV
jgi:predicted CoA-binding protein